MNKLTIKQKMLLMAAIAGMGLIALVSLNSLAMEALGRLHNVSSLSAELRSDMLMLRRHEKDFLARKELKYLQKFQQTYQQMMQRVEQLQAQVHSAEIEKQQVNNLAKVISDYRQHFLLLAEQQQIIGLDAIDGLYGSLRAQVHKVESLVKEYEQQHGESAELHSLMRTLLMLRRHEKDFMLRKQHKYVAQFTARMALMQQKVLAVSLEKSFKSSAVTALNHYDQQFLQLVSAEQKLGLNSQQGILAQMRAVIHQSETLIDALGQQITKATVNLISREKLLNLSAAGLLLVLTMAAIFALSKNITGRISLLAGLMSKASRERDLSSRIHLSGADEIAAMANVFDQMMQEFDNLMQQVRQSSRQLSQAATELQESSEQSHRGVNLQLLNSEQLAAAMGQVNVSATEVAGHCAEAVTASKQAQQASAKGQLRVQENVLSYTKLIDEIQSSSLIIEELNQQSSNIGAMLENIGSIADQTNLLALNAAIEAARAGEQGRGFAVVADEVRNLAMRSSRSTQDIEEVIGKLQRLAGNAVAAMTRGGLQAEDSMQNTDNVSVALEHINGSSEAVNNINVQIAAAADEQLLVCTEVSHNIESIAAIARETASLSEQVADSGLALQSLSEQLSENVQLFKLSA